jgi:tRNA U55 pseudouridine synthase TruB
VDLSHLELLGVEGPQVTLALECSAGFYVRALARDLGLALGCGAHLTALRRTRAGEFTLADAVPLARLEEESASLERLVLPLDRMLTWLPAASLGSSQVERVRHGNPVNSDEVDWVSTAGTPLATNPGGTEDGPHVRLLGPGDHLVAVARSVPGGSSGVILQPAVVLV